MTTRNINTPVLPAPAAKYTPAWFSRYNDILRIYFTRLNKQITKIPPEDLQAQTWFLG